MTSFMIGLPGETEEQLRETLEYIKNIDSSIIIYLYSPVENTDIYNDLVKSGKLGLKTDETSFFQKHITMENPGYNFSHIPDIELKVIKAYFECKAFSDKETVNGSYSYAFAVQTVKNGLKAISRNGLISFFVNGIKAVGTFLSVFYYSHFYPKNLKKYDLK